MQELSSVAAKAMMMPVSTMPRISKQDLSASKQDLCASKQDVFASKQDVFASKQGLSSCKKDLFPSKQVLSISKQGLSACRQDLFTNTPIDNTNHGTPTTISDEEPLDTPECINRMSQTQSPRSRSGSDHNDRGTRETKALEPGERSRQQRMHAESGTGTIDSKTSPTQSACPALMPEQPPSIPKRQVLPAVSSPCTSESYAFRHLQKEFLSFKEKATTEMAVLRRLVDVHRAGYFADDAMSAERGTMANSSSGPDKPTTCIINVNEGGNVTVRAENLSTNADTAFGQAARSDVGGKEDGQSAVRAIPHVVINPNGNMPALPHQPHQPLQPTQQLPQALLPSPPLQHQKMGQQQPCLLQNQQHPVQQTVQPHSASLPPPLPQSMIYQQHSPRKNESALSYHHHLSAARMMTSRATASVLLPLTRSQQNSLPQSSVGHGRVPLPPLKEKLRRLNMESTAASSFGDRSDTLAESRMESMGYRNTRIGCGNSLPRISRTGQVQPHHHQKTRGTSTEYGSGQKQTGYHVQPVRNAMAGTQALLAASADASLTTDSVSDDGEVLLTGKRRASSMDTCARGPSSRGDGQHGSRKKRFRDNWTDEEDAVFFRLVEQNRGMPEQSLVRMLADQLGPRRSYHQCKGHLKNMRAAKKL